MRDQGLVDRPLTRAVQTGTGNDWSGVGQATTENDAFIPRQAKKGFCRMRVLATLDIRSKMKRKCGWLEPISSDVLI